MLASRESPHSSRPAKPSPILRTGRAVRGNGPTRYRFCPNASVACIRLTPWTAKRSSPASFFATAVIKVNRRIKDEPTWNLVRNLILLASQRDFVRWSLLSCPTCGSIDSGRKGRSHLLQARRSDSCRRQRPKKPVGKKIRGQRTTVSASISPQTNTARRLRPSPLQNQRANQPRPVVAIIGMTALTAQQVPRDGIPTRQTMLRCRDLSSTIIPKSFRRPCCDSTNRSNPMRG